MSPTTGKQPQSGDGALRPVVTTCICPPIPVRNCDWQAHFDGDEPNDDGQMLVGRGATEDEAIADLLENAGLERAIDHLTRSFAEDAGAGQ